jgi:hypothetical protein
MSMATLPGCHCPAALSLTCSELEKLATYQGKCAAGVAGGCYPLKWMAETTKQSTASCSADLPPNLRSYEGT